MGDQDDAVAGVLIVIVGGGPRGSGLLERLVANARVLPGPALQIHVVDPHPVGGGRVWRSAQSRLLLMNSMAEDVTMFLDESVVVDGPLRTGPTLLEWARQSEPSPLRPAELEAELATVTGRTFPSRLAQNSYLDWAFRRAVDDAPDHVTVRQHAADAITIVDLPAGRQRVELTDGTTSDADVVLLALGHLDATPSPAEQQLTEFADRHGLRYLPPGYTADQDLSVLQPGEDVILRGVGLAIDLTVLLTEGRGGAYRRRADGRLDYLPSGREPVLHVGSRRGVPYQAKLGYRLLGPPAPLPYAFTAKALDALLAGQDTLEFDRDVLPLILADVQYGYYHELFVAHPDRVSASWQQFEQLVQSDGLRPLRPLPYPERSRRHHEQPPSDTSFALDHQLAGSAPPALHCHQP